MVKKSPFFSPGGRDLARVRGFSEGLVVAACVACLGVFEAGLVGEVGGVSVTSDGLGVGFSWPGPRAGSGEGDGRGQWGVGCCWGAGRWPMRLARGFGLLAGLVE